MAMWPFGKKKKDAGKDESQDKNTTVRTDAADKEVKEATAEPASAESLATKAGESSTAEGPAQASAGAGPRGSG